MCGFLHQSRARIVVLVHAVPKAHQTYTFRLRLHLVHIALNRLTCVANLIEHAQNRFIRATVQRTSKGAHTGRNRCIQVRLRGADQTNGRGRTVLFVISMKNQQHIECSNNRRINVVRLIGHAEGHADEVFGVATLRVWVQQWQACGTLRDVADHGRHLRQQKHQRGIQLSAVARIKRVFVVGCQACDTRLENRHGVAPVRERREEGLEVFVKQAVALDGANEALQCGCIREFAVDQQVGDL